MKRESVAFRPHARLLTMLGEQLIKNERIALVELIKNSYDADAERVEVRFENFDEDMTPNAGSSIVVQDDGVGMTVETLRNDWMNPATPTKHLAKLDGRGKTPTKRRTMQGEKGIGRFAVLKLGREIRIASRQSPDAPEAVLTWDFSRFDDDFVSEDGDRQTVFLDQIRADVSQREPDGLSDVEHGTAIVIRNLKGRWGKPAITRLCRDVLALTDPISRITRREPASPLEIVIFFNGQRQVVVEEQGAERLRALIEEKAVLNLRGHFESGRNTFAIDSKGFPVEKTVSLDDPRITGLWVWRERCREAQLGPPNQLALAGLDLRLDHFECGDFSFHFFIFDFARRIDGRYALMPDDRKILRDHRIYLYRDGVRVYPYGDPDDDWLEIDTARGTGRAGNFLSNDQTIGWIDITQERNPQLRDKTNREGLIESGGAARDLIFLVKLFLSYVKQYPFAQYKHKQLQQSTARLVDDQRVAMELAALRADLDRAGHRSQAKAAGKIAKDYSRERAHLVRRAEITEDLAGVGLSVEMASHDIMLLLARAQGIARQLVRTTRLEEDGEVAVLTERLAGVLQLLGEGMRDVQTLFKSARRRRKRLRIGPLLAKIHQIYSPLLEERSIRYSAETKGTSPLVASTTDGVVMQVLINLFDNAAYWLESVDSDAREICVTLDGERGDLIFADSGPGIASEDLPYIFDAFYSGKGQDGRGLGLYIARQLLARHDYGIEVADEHDRILGGANFIVSFVNEDA